MKLNNPDRVRESPMVRRALAMWPRLDPRALARCAGNPARLARHVSRRTNLPPDIIRAILTPPLAERDGELWFG